MFVALGDLTRATNIESVSLENGTPAVRRVRKATGLDEVSRAAEATFSGDAARDP